MHRAFSLILAILLLVALAVPCFASTPYPSDLPTYTDKVTDIQKHAYLLKDSVNQYKLITSNEPVTWDGSNCYWSSSSQTVYYYSLTNGSWNSGTKWNSAGEGKVIVQNVTLVWELVEEVECDGSSCPATDANHDNICDDCGNILTYNLRSTLLTFAQTRAESFANHPYYAVVKHLTEANKYDVYVSASEMHINEPDYDTVYGQNLMWFQVYENDDGTFSYTGELSVTKWAGEVVYANHVIENFTAPPLAVAIQGVTGEAMEQTLPTMVQEILVIVKTAVCCLGLLVSVILLVKKFRRYLP